MFSILFAASIKMLKLNWKRERERKREIFYRTCKCKNSVLQWATCT